MGHLSLVATWESGIWKTAEGGRLQYSFLRLDLQLLDHYNLVFIVS